MAFSAYLKLKGQAQGDIRGSVVQKGREGSISVLSARHGLAWPPVEAATGVAGGALRHGPFVISKDVDKASVPLYRALVSNERLVDWTLNFWRPAPNGAEQQHYTIKLTDARIASIDFRMPDRRDPQLVAQAQSEEIAFLYTKIEWVWTADAASAVASITGNRRQARGATLQAPQSTSRPVRAKP